MPPISNSAGENPADEQAAGGPADSAGMARQEAPLPPPEGAALGKQGDLAAAEAAFREAALRAPRDAGARHNLGVALAIQGKLDVAVTAFGEALTIDPRAAETHRNLALALSRLGRRVDAERHWREAV